MNLRERVYRAHLMHLRIQKHSVLTKLCRSRKQNPEKRRGLSLRQRYRNLKVGNNFLRTRNRELGARVSELNRQNQQWQTTNHQLRRDVHFWKLVSGMFPFKPVIAEYLHLLSDEYIGCSLQ